MTVGRYLLFFLLFIATSADAMKRSTTIITLENLSGNLDLLNDENLEPKLKRKMLRTILKNHCIDLDPPCCGCGEKNKVATGKYDNLVYKYREVTNRIIDDNVREKEDWFLHSCCSGLCGIVCGGKACSLIVISNLFFRPMEKLKLFFSDCCYSGEGLEDV